MQYRDILEATRLTRAGELRQATTLLQRALRGETTAGAATASAPPASTSRILNVTPHQPSSTDGQAFGSAPNFPGKGMTGAGSLSYMPEALRSLLEQVKSGLGSVKPSAAPAQDIVPDGGRFISGSYRNHAGSRAYKLYIPSGCAGQALPLVIMLHGCTQSPEDFAAGTRMNVIAEEHTCLVAYPEQSAAANASRCWNWFRPGDQQRDEGEPSLIAGITRRVMHDYSVDPDRVYVAGLSAGGAAATILGLTYPDLYSAVGVHSGLACGVACDLPSAFAAMRQGNASISVIEGREGIIPTIVFHGDRDTTVHPRNGDHVIAQSNITTNMQTDVHRGRVPEGHTYTRTLYMDAGGRAVLERWDVHGAGHAWSGGSPLGSYTDPRGPDASREMVRFFLSHSRIANS
jgi:poly(hydroxyalkanoate) depolymerase family esterase